MHPALVTFIERMDELVASTSDPAAIAAGVEERLPPLLAETAFLEDRFRRPSEDGYQQYVVHVHPEGLYSIVSLVWQPGQSTPVHDHRCWCVVGVLEGREQESRYSLHAKDDEEWLVERSGVYYHPGEVCSLVPPQEDIHRVGNASEDGAPTISMHIYGADISEVGTSINRTFDLPVRAGSEGDPGTEISWRAHDDHFLTAATR